MDCPAHHLSEVCPQLPSWLVGLGIAVGVVLLLLLIPYYIYLVRSILEMLRRPAPAVLLGFSLLALIPLPPLILLGVLLMIIWHQYKKSG